MNSEDLLHGFFERGRGRGIDATEPFLKFYQLLLGVLVRGQRNGSGKQFMSLLSVFLWEVFLNIAIFMDCAALVDKVLAVLVSQSFDDAFATVSDKNNFF